MDRATLDGIITQCAEALSCDDCNGELFKRIAYAAIECAAQHNAQELGNRVAANELTAVEAFDTLVTSLRPLYRAIGQDVCERELAAIRRYVEGRAGARLN